MGGGLPRHRRDHDGSWGAVRHLHRRGGRREDYHCAGGGGHDRGHEVRRCSLSILHCILVFLEGSMESHHCDLLVIGVESIALQCVPCSLSPRNVRLHLHLQGVQDLSGVVKAALSMTYRTCQCYALFTKHITALKEPSFSFTFHGVLLTDMGARWSLRVSTRWYGLIAFFTLVVARHSAEQTSIG